MKRGQRMTAAEFETIRPLLNISEERMEAGRLCFVEGKEQADVAKIYGWTQQGVSKIVRGIWKTFESHRAGLAAGLAASAVSGRKRLLVIGPAAFIESMPKEWTDATGSPHMEVLVPTGWQQIPLSVPQREVSKLRKALLQAIIDHYTTK